jgi:hypothetical protein
VESLGSSGTGNPVSIGPADRRASASEPSEGAPDRESVGGSDLVAASVLFGVDRVSVSAPVAGFEKDPSAWATFAVVGPGTPKAARRWGASAKLTDTCTLFIGVQEVPATGMSWCKLELNPSRWADSDGHSLASVSSTHEAVEEAMDRASEWLVPAVPDAGALKVRRLDVARDFSDVARPSYLIRGLGPVHRPWARRNLVHYDPGRSGAQTLMVGSGAGVVRLYDKDQETGGAAPGVVRWEAECRRSWVQNYGNIETLNDVTGESVDALGTDRWEWSAMDTEVSAMEAVVEKVMRSDLSFAEQRGLIGYLTMIAAGGDVRAATSTHSKYRRTAKHLGITVDPGSLSGDDPGFSARLDLELGTAVCSVR